MNARPESFRDVIGLWATKHAMAADVGVTIEQVRKWAQRGSIPPQHWLAVVTAAHRRGYLLSLEDLARIAAGVAQPNAA